jgi:hypothetical protein
MTVLILRPDFTINYFQRLVPLFDEISTSVPGEVEHNVPRGLAAVGDSFQFVGYGTEAQGASFSQIPATNQWQIHSGLDDHNEIITLQNSASVHASDFIFV